MVGSSSLGERLRRYRVTADLPQEELAGRAGISARVVSDLERGISQMPRKNTLRLLADALGLTEEARATLSGPRHLAGTPLAPLQEPAVLPHGGYLGALPSSILVARDHECERITCALDAVASGEGRLSLLAGEPGVGKTRLAQEALAAYNLALAAFERLGDHVGQALVHRDIAWVHQWHDDFAVAWPHLEAALALWPAERTNGELTHLLDAARARRAAGDTEEAAALAGRGLALAGQRGYVQLRVRALLELALVRIASGANLQALIVLLDEAEGMAREAGDLRTLGWICSHRADARRLAGDARGAFADCRQSLDIAIQSGLRSAAVTPFVALAALCCRLGEWAEGRALLRRAHQTDPLVRPRDVAVWLALLQGDRDALHTALQEALGEDLRGGDVGRVREWLAWMWRLALWEGQLKEAERLVQQWLELAPPTWDPGIAAAAEVLVRRCSPEDAATLAAAERAMTETGAELMCSGVLRAQGLLAWQSGDPERTVEALEASAAAARAHGELLELGCSLAILTTAAQERGETWLARAADAERMAIVAQIGPEPCRLGWLWANPT
jgi:transcriptional regulator with XRE-family HTH domain/tetratricopeptide (TPR) repeat protein